MAVSKIKKKDFTGKVGNKVTYLLNGQWVERTIGINNAPPTLLQKAIRAAVALVADLLRPVKGFIRAGFAIDAKGTLHSANNKAVSENIMNAVQGEYPDQYIDFTRVIFSKGKMPVVKADVAVTESGLIFTWDKDSVLKGMQPSDRVMMIAYCPEKKYAFYEIDGARRWEGRDLLPMVKYHERVIIHTYVAFMSATRKSISTSLYTGEFLW